jgi:hypothetical protein
MGSIRNRSARAVTYGPRPEFRSACLAPGKPRHTVPGEQPIRGSLEPVPTCRDGDSGEDVRLESGQWMQAAPRLRDCPRRRTQKFPPRQRVQPVATSARRRLFLPSTEEGFHIAVRHKAGLSGALNLPSEPSLLFDVGRKYLRRDGRFFLSRAFGDLGNFATGVAIKLDGQSAYSRLALWLCRGEWFSDIAHDEFLKIWKKSLARNAYRRFATSAFFPNSERIGGQIDPGVGSEPLPLSGFDYHKTIVRRGNLGGDSQQGPCARSTRPSATSCNGWKPSPLYQRPKTPLRNQVAKKHHELVTFEI